MTMNAYPPITIVTGPRKSGRTTYAVLVGSELYKAGYDVHHNGTALFGWVYGDDYLKNPDGLLTLAQGVPANTPILIEEADIHVATRQSDDPAHDVALAAALAELAEKSCYLILTTVEGNECQISRSLVENAIEHVTPYMVAETKERLALATLHRFGKRLIPAPLVQHDPESVYKAMALADTFKETREGASDGTSIQHSQDRFFEVPQRNIDQMKYPEYPKYPVHYRYRIIRKIGDRQFHRLTKDSLLNFGWLEGVNEHPHETVVLEMLDRTMSQWGFKYEPVEVPQDTSFPDGRALIDGELTNLEVISIQPRYSGKHSLHDLVGLSKLDKALEPHDDAMLVCRTCRIEDPVPGTTLENLSDHDEDHLWVMYLPNSQFAPDFPNNLTITPLLTITQEGFSEELADAVQRKSGIIAKQGAGHKNWVIVLAQGFPVEPQWYGDLPDQWPENVDGIVVAATDMYLGATHDFLPYHELTMVLLKRPMDREAHNCYDPSYLYRVVHFDHALNPLSADTHTVSELSFETFDHLWPPHPIHRTLVARDENENELDRREDVLITGRQINEILRERNYVWQNRGVSHMMLCHQVNDDPLRCLGEVWQIVDDGDHRWAAAVDYGTERVYEEFATVADAKRWCEGEAAITLLDIDP